MNVYQSLLEKKQRGHKSFTVLIDPDKITPSSFSSLLLQANEAKVD